MEQEANLQQHQRAIQQRGLRHYSQLKVPRFQARIGMQGKMKWVQPLKHQPRRVQEEEQVQSTNNKDKHFQDNDEIVVIPDLDEDGGDTDQRIARAPKNITRKIPTLADLESEVKAAIPQSEGGFDLSVLLNTLVPPQQVQEGDEHWTFESLLRDVTDELMVPTKTVLEATVLPQSPTSPVPAERTKSSKEKKK
jgi:hypothetical protein